MTTLKVDEIRRIVTETLNHIENESGQVLELDHDYFWSLPTESLFDVTSQPASFTVGQVSESIDFLKSKQGGHLSYELVWLADVLRAIGAQLVR